MGRIEEYREMLRNLETWEDYLLSESRLPGPRANLELAFVVAAEATAEKLLKWANIDADQAPKNTKGEFLSFCGVLGLGYLAARGEGHHFDLLREKASDSRWRIREAVALGLQKYGEKYFDELFTLMEEWSNGSPLEQRAVVASLCEPRLLDGRDHAILVFDLLDDITTSIIESETRREEGFKTLRKGLAYGWSVVVAAHPEIGKPRMEHWVKSEDPDVRWIMKQNLKKSRLSKVDSTWVESQLEILSWQ